MKASLALAALMILLGAGCATTERQTVKQSPAHVPLVGADVCAELAPGARGKRDCAT